MWQFLEQDNDLRFEIKKLFEVLSKLPESVVRICTVRQSKVVFCGVTFDVESQKYR